MRNEILEKGFYYHIYNRGINSCKIFDNHDNYKYFMRLFAKHLSSHTTLYAYCLLKNHFHFVLKIEKRSKFITQQFSNFFNAYAKAYNKQQNRTGSLFEKTFKRIKLDSDNYLKQLILYTHTNPVKHGFLEDFEAYPFSSYNEIVNNSSNFIPAKEVIELFSDLENFKYTHKYKSNILNNKFKLE